MNWKDSKTGKAKPSSEEKLGPASDEDSRQGMSQKRIFSHLSASTLVVVFIFAACQFELDGLKGLIVDSQFRLKFWQSPHPDILIVAYDEKSSARYNYDRKIPALEMARLFDVFAQDRPSVVGIVGTLDDRTYTEYDILLMRDSFSRVPQTLIGYNDDKSYSNLQANPFAPEALAFPGFISRDNYSYGADSVSRRIMLSIGGLPTLYTEIVKSHLGIQGRPHFSHSHSYGDRSTLQTYNNWQGGPSTYSIHSSIDVALETLPKGYFTDKIVLLGTALKSQKSTDFVLTPYSRNPTKTTVLEAAAHSVATLLRNNSVFKPPPWIDWILSLVVGLVTLNMVLFLSPVRGILFVLLELLGLYFVSWIALVHYDCWINLAHPFVIACFSYYLVIPYRLVSEYRQRWHYQQKSEVMVQLEQLKSNFLSMVSHDLKTPIARIRGNAELLMQAESDQKRVQSLSAIVKTSDNLNQYVESILDVTRIESAQIPIQKASKDINATILEVLENKRYLADDKGIELVSQLEPIFSFKFDPKLIRRVIANIVENAIKYSRPNGKVTLKSWEDENWIRVAVQDQGVGIPKEEQDQVFTKFYRCENESTKQEKGTGLGLYLVKYFVELHRGFVDLKSEVGKGTEFTIALPV